MSKLNELELVAVGTWVDACKETEYLKPALDKLPGYTGVLYRGCDYEESTDLPTEVGQEVTIHRLASWSTVRECAEEYCQGYNGNYSVLYVLGNNTRGKYISDVAETDYSENEVLVLDETSYRVTYLREGSGGLLEVGVEEV